MTALRPPDERGGTLLVLVGCPDHEWEQVEALLSRRTQNITVLARADQQKTIMRYPSVECWVIDRLGLRGFLALIRRISWRRFDRVIDPWPQAFGFLRYWVWPRPHWFCQSGIGELPVDLHENSPKH